MGFWGFGVLPEVVTFNYEYACLSPMNSPERQKALDIKLKFHF